jgi:acetate kinase
LQNAKAKIISIHLGNGCSIAAIDAGKSIDTSMGFGPLSGLIMGTRSGDIDPSVIFHLVDQLHYDINAVKDLLNKQSGMLALAGHTDMRDISKAIAEGNKQSELAYEMYAYRIIKYIGAYAAVLNGLDAVVFTAGVGENDADVRMRVCKNLSYLGIIPDEEKNRQRSNYLREISSDASRVKVLVVPTNEELEIAKQCFGLIG